MLFLTLTLLLACMSFLLGAGAALAYSVLTSRRRQSVMVDMDELLGDFTVFRTQELC